MKTLKYIFNFLRNISLIFLIAVIAFTWYLNTNKSLAYEFLSSLELQNIDSSKENHDLSKDDFGIMSVEETPLLGKKTARKIEIKIKDGIAFLRPSQIMYVEIKDSEKELITTDEDRFYLNWSLTKLNNVLGNIESERFFKTKNAILNCNYIQQIIQESRKYNEKYTYQYFVVMQDKNRIKISEDKSKELKKMLTELFS